jgi:hypothetical protein
VRDDVVPIPLDFLDVADDLTDGIRERPRGGVAVVRRVVLKSGCANGVFEQILQPPSPTSSPLVISALSSSALSCIPRGEQRRNGTGDHPAPGRENLQPFGCGHAARAESVLDRSSANRWLSNDPNTVHLAR